MLNRIDIKNMNPETLEFVKSALIRIGSCATPLAANEAHEIIAKAKDTFVQDNPRAWWMSLKGNVTLIDSKKYNLEEVLPPSSNGYWFIPETEADELPVFDLTLLEIKGVLNECPFFEYYILDKKILWLVVESDHNQFHLAKII